LEEIAVMIIIISTLYQILLGVVKLRSKIKGEMGGTCSTPKEKRYLKKLGIGWG
jgi:hypothetical protein